MSEQKQDFRHDKQVNAPGTIGEGGKRFWLYPERRPGARATRRKWLAIALIAFYLIVPWIQIDGSPILRLDVLEQKAYIFGLVLQMTEFHYIFFALAALALLLFLVTTLRGRIWCGYACPQTVFVEWVIRPIEEFFEGPARARRRLDLQPLTPKKGAIKFAKHGTYILVCVTVAHGLLGFFIDPRTLVGWVTSPPSDHPTAFGFVMAVSALIYFDLSYFREQFCAFLCPYARFQSAMLDAASPSVNYDSKRGDPRGKGQGKGDCIDCGLCVRVCPTGIDIRNGLQLECIQCERCIDACQSIMTNLGRDPGLIRIASTQELSGVQTSRWKRPRVYVYSLMIVAILAAGLLKLTSRPALSLTILRQQGVAFSEIPDGRLSNMFTARVNNTTTETLKINIELVNKSDELSLLCPTCGSTVEAHGEALVPLLILFPKGSQERTANLRVVGGTKIYELPIIGPENGK